MSTSYFPSHEPCAVVGPAMLRELRAAAERAPLRRARVCLHEGPADPLHEMIIVFCRDSYVAPHRHAHKSESFHVLAGEVEVVFFADDGAVTGRLVLSAVDPARPRIYRLRLPLWHTVLIRSDWAALHETTNGPFRPGDAEVAPWAAHPDDPAAVARFRADLDSPAPEFATLDSTPLAPP